MSEQGRQPAGWAEQRQAAALDEGDHGWGGRGALWLLVLGPALWALHFLLCYITAAIWCARVAGGGLGGARAAIAVYTAVAVLGMAFGAWRGFRQAGQCRGAGLHRDSRDARRRFLGYATGLLALLSLLATVYVALGAVFIGDCR